MLSLIGWIVVGGIGAGLIFDYAVYKSEMEDKERSIKRNLNLILKSSETELNSKNRELFAFFKNIKNDKIPKINLSNDAVYLVSRVYSLTVKKRNEILYMSISKRDSRNTILVSEKEIKNNKIIKFELSETRDFSQSDVDIIKMFILNDLESVFGKSKREVTKIDSLKEVFVEDEKVTPKFDIYKTLEFEKELTLIEEKYNFLLENKVSLDSGDLHLIDTIVKKDMYKILYSYEKLTDKQKDNEREYMKNLLMDINNKLEAKMGIIDSVKKHDYDVAKEILKKRLQ